LTVNKFQGRVSLGDHPACGLYAYRSKCSLHKGLARFVSVEPKLCEQFRNAGIGESVTSRRCRLTRDVPGFSRAPAWFAAGGVAILGVRTRPHLRTRPYTPRTSGYVEHFIQPRASAFPIRLLRLTVNYPPQRVRLPSTDSLMRYSPLRAVM